MNTDAIADFAAVSTETLFVYLGQGQGTFRRYGARAVAGCPTAIEIADFDSDGRPDVALALEYYHAIAVLLGDGHGGFVAASTVITRRWPSSIAVGDLDADGSLDLVVTGPGGLQEYPVTTAILMGRGDGTFATGREVETGLTCRDVELADLNADTRLDLIVANDGPNTVSVLLGLGGGTFASRVAFETGAMPHSLTVADFDRDGNSDVATADYAVGTITILAGTGDGRLTRGAQFATGSAPTSIACPDLNHDGFPDLVTARSIPPLSIGKLSIHLSTGNGGFEPRLEVSAPRGAARLAIADVDQDGFLDAVVACRDAVAILLGNGRGRLGSESLVPVGQAPVALATSDIDGDGHLDLAVANDASETISIQRSDPRGGFSPSGQIPTGPDPTCLAFQNMNEDSWPDLIIAHAGTSGLRIWLGNGDGSFRPGSSVAGFVPTNGLALADFDLDGNVDVALVHRHSFNPAIRLYLGDGQGGFREVRSIDHITYDTVTSGDVNRDGRPDLVAAGRDAVRTYLGRGDGSFDAAVPFETGWTTSMAISDLDLDGSLDLALVGVVNAAIAFGRGDGSWERFETIGAAHGPGIDVRDLDGDGLPDIVVSNRESDTISFFRGLGEGRFAPRIDFGTAFRPSGLVLGDFNEDRRDDIAVATWAGYISVLTNRLHVTPLLVEGLTATATPSFVRLVWRLPQEGLRQLSGVTVDRARCRESHFEPRTLHPLLPSASMEFQDNQVEPETDYVYRLSLRFSNGPSAFSSSIQVRTGFPVSGSPRLEAPRVFLGDPWVQVRYALPQQALAALRIHDIRGRLLWSHRSWAEPGEHALLWNPGSEKPVSRGVYILSLEANGLRATRKFLLPPGWSFGSH